MPDLLYLLNSLVDNKGRILITGLNTDIEPLTAEEEKLYHNIDFDVKAYQDEIGSNKLLYNGDKVNL